MAPVNPLYFWTLLAFLATLGGSLLLFLNQEWSRGNIWRILAFGSGILLGVAFLHVLPEAYSLTPEQAGLGVLAAFLLIFFIEGFTLMHSCVEFAEECSIHVVSWTAFAAIGLHSLIDGIAIAVAFQKNAQLGRVVAGAILIHKLTDGLTLTGMLLASHYSKRRCLKIVALMALATPLGALIFSPYASYISDPAMGWILGFVAGSFFYVGASDILPRLHKVRDAYCLVWFALGLAMGGVHW